MRETRGRDIAIGLAIPSISEAVASVGWFSIDNVVASPNEIDFLISFPKEDDGGANRALGVFPKEEEGGASGAVGVESVRSFLSLQLRVREHGDREGESDKESRRRLA